MVDLLKLLTVAITLNVFLISCNNKQTKTEDVTAITQSDLIKTEGYKLMESKCYICHFETPDPAKMNQMIAPPMLRIKEHYLPNYQNKEDFIAAIMNIVNNPSEEKTLMPGAVKKFNLMPKLNYNQDELKLIAETIYEYEFGSAPKMAMLMMGDLRLDDNGNPWKLKPETIEKADSILNRLYSFKSNNIKDYNQLGKDVFEQAKFIMLDKSYTGDKFDQIHNFFYSVEDDMHALIEEKSIENAKTTVEDMKTKFNNFYNFFSAE
ncbi:hypothetical protein EV196_10339 [Mariniflexile fucanivorans]|uniref:Cytochrome c domain-containing protein n=1 Tax=Mariniflexile fucanivorans TaxID=264023 RepID=A0A4R1RL87_9FLAO|nr:hypothetical protein [Mariniflexile fucanivorans]TCL66630.1 hypothetical protein EV196_10339 [Mariniflexile fucanivorans]